MRILDLGCGAGRDVYLLSQLAGPSGAVVGVDMTAKQLAVAERYREHHAREFGFANVTFQQGYIEQLDALPLQAGSFDLIVSNCVMNLSPDKAAVLAGAWRLLRPGGEFYFADVYADRRLPAALRKDPVLVGECLGGALYWGDFVTLAGAAGFRDTRLVADRPIAVVDEQLAGQNRRGAVLLSYLSTVQGRSVRSGPGGLRSDSPLRRPSSRAPGTACARQTPRVPKG